MSGGVTFVCIIILLDYAASLPLEISDVQNVRKIGLPEEAPDHSLTDLDKDQSIISPENQDQELVEMKEEDIPEGAWVLVVDDAPISAGAGEILQPSDNIVFRPLFQYRNKQQRLAERRQFNRARRRYYVSRRPYRQADYYYQNYYPRRYHYNYRYY